LSEHTDIAIGELSRQTGCDVETIRYYERIGLRPRCPLIEVLSRLDAGQAA